MTFDQSLAKLARHVAEKATHKNTPFSETLDAFGKLTTYYSALKKTKAPSEEASDGADFLSFQSALEGNDGSAEIRSDPGRA